MRRSITADISVVGATGFGNQLNAGNEDKRLAKNSPDVSSLETEKTG